MTREWKKVYDAYINRGYHAAADSIRYSGKGDNPVSDIMRFRNPADLLKEIEMWG